MHTPALLTLALSTSRMRRCHTKSRDVISVRIDHTWRPRYVWSNQIIFSCPGYLMRVVYIAHSCVCKTTANRKCCQVQYIHSASHELCKGCEHISHGLAVWDIVDVGYFCMVGNLVINNQERTLLPATPTEVGCLRPSWLGSPRNGNQTADLCYDSWVHSWLWCDSVFFITYLVRTRIV